ncbi:hypothetical protein [Frondihabitans australicus]|uniref:PH (Pleckstrin Homology) domain-containing protein n=1 Tax=Frondihabitans australicus TaxID=386892 RepID=A0A495IGI2_9MICO|nr:hypothetical protein [Frondihabitans australicus]RKR74186.1 hypothetical protein C8E83_1294 [Frondihabitans australicus]
MSALPDRGDWGGLLWSAKPFSVGIRETIAVNASAPFPRGVALYENGILLRSLATKVFVSRIDITEIHRGPGYVRIVWGAGGHRASAVVNDLWRIRRTVAALREHGFDVQGGRAKNDSSWRAR